jgi:hypothetical protein
MLRGVLSQDPPAGCEAHREPPGVTGVAEPSQRILRTFRNQDLLARNEEFIEALPPVADHGHGTTASLEQTNAWRVTPLLHLGASDIERKPLGCVEVSVLAWRQVGITVDIRGPGYLLRIHRTHHREPALFPLARRIHK